MLLVNNGKLIQEMELFMDQKQILKLKIIIKDHFNQLQYNQTLIYLKDSIYNIKIMMKIYRKNKKMIQLIKKYKMK